MKHYEFKIGLVVILGLILIILGLYLTNSLPFLSQGYRIYMKLSYGANVPVGANVKLAGGIKVGRVESVRENPKEGGVIIILFIENRYKINKDAIFVVQTASLVGEKYIDILNYTGNPPFLKDGETVIGRESASLTEAISDIFENIRKIIAQVGSSEEIPQSLEKIFLIVSYLEMILREVNKNRDQISISIKNISEFSEQIKKAAQEINTLFNALNQLSGNIGKTDIKKLNETINNLNLISTEIYKSITNTNTVIGVLTDEELGKTLRKTIKNLEVFSRKIADRPSTLIDIFR